MYNDNLAGEQSEIWSVITPDGNEYVLNNGLNQSIARLPDNLGLPPISWETQKPYQAVGVTETGYTLDPRRIVLEYTATFLTRDEYWDHRAWLLNLLRPNRTNEDDKEGQHILSLTRDSGDVRRSIYCRFESPTFSEDLDSDPFMVRENIQVVCFDPTWFDPAADTLEFSSDSIDELEFPIRFDGVADIRFGETGLWATAASLTYEGTWFAYPTIVATGPFDSLRIIHNQTGAELFYAGAVANGSTLTIDISSKSVDVDGVDKLGFMSPDSDFVGFRLEPDAVASDGINTFQLFLPGNSVPATTVQLQYNNRYIGI